MRIVLLGPILTSACRQILGLKLVDAPDGTAQTPIVPLAGALRALGHEIHIITTDPTVDRSTTIKEDGFSITYCPLRGSPRYRARVRSLDMFEKEIRALKSEILSSNPDIVHAHWTYEFAEAAVRSGIPHVVTMHDLGWQYLGIYRDLYRAMRLLMKYRVMPRVRALTVVAPFMATKAWNYGYFGSIDVVPNGVEVRQLNLPERDSRRACEAPVFVTIGNDGPIKNVSAAINAFEMIRKKKPAAILHLFGPGLDSEFARGKLGVIGHGNTKHSELMEFLKEEGTILIHPSRMECCPVIILEAKARGVPVVGGRNSGGVEFVCGSFGSCLADVEDPRSIADAAEYLISSESVYSEARRSAVSDVKHRFSDQIVATEYERIYRKILKRSGA